MEHACFENIDAEFKYSLDPVAFNRELTEPQFIGQGCSRRVGSDQYGSYIVEKKQIGKKTIWGIAPAKTHFAIDWTDGSEVCDGPTSWKAHEWIIKWGNRWWYCNEDGKRINGSKCRMAFKGAFAYRDPSF